MKKVESKGFFAQKYYYQKGTPQEKSGFGLRKSVERLVIIGGTLLTLDGFGMAIDSCSKLEQAKRTDTIENIVNYEEGKYSLRQKLLIEEEINNRLIPPETYFLGVLGLISAVIAGCYRSGRRQFEKKGYVIDGL